MGSTRRSRSRLAAPARSTRCRWRSGSPPTPARVGIRDQAADDGVDQLSARLGGGHAGRASASNQQSWGMTSMYWPNLPLRTTSGLNVGHQPNKEFDELLDEANSALDEDVAIAKYRAVDALNAQGDVARADRQRPRAGRDLAEGQEFRPLLRLVVGLQEGVGGGVAPPPRAPGLEMAQVWPSGSDRSDAPMLRPAAYRTAIPTLIGVSIVTFGLLHLVPGGPVVGDAGVAPRNPAAVAAVTKELGLDRPLWDAVLALAASERSAAISECRRSSTSRSRR